MKQFNCLALGLIMVAIFARLIPHAPNFAPVGAVAIFAGAYLDKKWSYLIPIAIMLLSDLLIGFYTPYIMAAVYISFIISVWLGNFAKKQKKASRIFILTFTGSVAFFLITNAAVWLFGQMYEPSLSGLWQSYYYALPFFRNTILSDLFYTAVLFGGYEIAIRMTRMTRIFVAGSK